jgi:fructose-1,6-bisphosphatase/inositol monophosphatase family enzyme
MVEAKAKIWDIAAVSLIVEEAGGKVTDFRGDALKGTEPTSVLATNGRMHSEVKSFFDK